MNAKGWIIVVIALGIVVGFSAPLASQERESEGTRMQAEPVEVGSVHHDRLTPPDEDAHWRMVQLKEETTLEVELDVDGSDRSAELRLTEATGDELESKTAGDDAVTVRQAVEAGIYYIAVESSQPVSYRLSIE